MARLLILLVFLAVPAAAQDIVAGLSKSRISISANFDGSEILIFGAVKRDAPPDGEDTGIIVTVEGPKTEVTVRRKSRVGPIWVNTDSVHIDAAPSFYAVSTSSPIEDILTFTSDLRHEITVQEAIRAVGATQGAEDASNFIEALVRLREGNRLYQTNLNTVTVQEETLFDTSVTLPANLVDGIYTARLFLTKGGVVVSQSSETIYVEKVGLEKLLYDLAHDQPWLYGILSLAIAIAAGWGASAAFRYFQS